MAMFRSRKTFDAQVRKILRATAGSGAEVYDIDEESVAVGNTVITLTNLRAKWHQLEDNERVGWLTAAVQALLSPPELPDRLETVEHLRPGLRPRAMLESTRLAGASAGAEGFTASTRPTIPFVPLGGEIVIVLLWDGPVTMSMVNQAQLNQWGARFEELLPIAINNLRDTDDAGWTAVENRVWSSLNDDDYAGARLLIPGYLDQTGLAGELVVAHPNRDLLIICAADDAEGIQTLCGLALDDLAAPSPISFRPIVGSPGNWRLLKLPESHPAYQEWKRLNYVDLKLSYDSVQEPLQHFLQGELVVAGASIIHDPDGSSQSYCTWTEGVPSLLPRTDNVDLVSRTGAVLTVEWESLHEQVRTMMEPTEHYPEMWRVVSFPSDQDLQRLRELRHWR